MTVPFVGPSYELRRKKSDVQRSINLMPTPVESGSGKSAVFLKQTPGMGVFSPIQAVLLYFTSHRYPYILVEPVDIGVTVASATLWTPPIDEVDIGVTTTAGEVVEVLVVYNEWPPEPIDIGLTTTAGEIVEVLVIYDLWPPEPIDIGVTTQSAVLTEILIGYTNWTEDKVDMDITVNAATLT